ncbi:ISL3 family transposase [Actinomadura sp. GC306]|nr:ISL3 family transposase [Actinomadura sp. GC306]
MLGVDDFAFRRGHTYGTILIDLVTGRPVDVLTDRAADTLAAWLNNHPGVEVICRDRAGGYAEGASRGAPDAIQVADRWHMWTNIGDAVERTVARHRDHLRDLPLLATPTGSAASPALDPTLPDPAPHAGLRTGPFADRVRQRHSAVHDLLAQGHDLRTIARTLGLARNTVRAEPQRWCGRNGPDQRCMAEVELHHRQRPWRSTAPATPPKLPRPTVRKAAGWFLRNPARLTTDEHHQLDILTQASPTLAALRRHVAAFAVMMLDRQGNRLESWMNAVQADDLPELHSFVTGLRRDFDAARAGLTLNHSSGPVEGHVNRIKTIKRQMYGRANPDLLRKRILLAD